MDELIAKLQSQAGLSPEQAQKAAGVVAEFLETKMSGDQLQSLAANVPGLSQYSSRIPGDAGAKLGGMVRGFRGKKD
jgi:hypothetical protein